MTDSKKRILLADDDAMTREGLAEFFREEGYRVDVASDGAEALAAFEAASVDLLVTDLDMPKLRGERLIEQLRTLDAELPVVVISGQDPLDAGRRSVGLSVSHYFTKPVDLEDVRRRVSALLDGSPRPRANEGPDGLRGASTPPGRRPANPGPSLVDHPPDSGEP